MQTNLILKAFAAWISYTEIVNLEWEAWNR